jgi:uncharacterized protein (DUF2141 family)
MAGLSGPEDRHAVRAERRASSAPRTDPVGQSVRLFETATRATLATGIDRMTNRLIVEVEGLRSDDGRVVAALYDRPQEFPNGASCRAAKVAIAHRSATMTFDDLAPGAYAVGLFHDENGNDKLDKNFLGIPKEGVGLSGYDRLELEMPTFARASFRFAGGEQTVKVHVHYLL